MHTQTESLIMYIGVAVVPVHFPGPRDHLYCRKLYLFLVPAVPGSYQQVAGLYLLVAASSNPSVPCCLAGAGDARWGDEASRTGRY